MEKQVKSSSLLAILAVIVFLVWSLGIRYRPGDYQIPQKFAVSAERFARNCPTVSSGCRVTLKNGSVVRASYCEAVLGGKIIFDSEVKDKKIKDIGLGKFLREGGFFIFDTPDFYR